MIVEDRSLSVTTQLFKLGLNSTMLCIGIGYWIARYPIETKWTAEELTTHSGCNRTVFGRNKKKLIGLGLIEEYGKNGREVIYRFKPAAYRLVNPHK